MQGTGKGYDNKLDHMMKVALIQEQAQGQIRAHRVVQIPVRAHQPRQGHPQAVVRALETQTKPPIARLI